MIIDDRAFSLYDLYHLSTSIHRSNTSSQPDTSLPKNIAVIFTEFLPGLVIPSFNFEILDQWSGFII